MQHGFVDNATSRGLAAAELGGFGPFFGICGPCGRRNAQRGIWNLNRADSTWARRRSSEPRRLWGCATHSQELSRPSVYATRVSLVCTYLDGRRALAGSAQLSMNLAACFESCGRSGAPPYQSLPVSPLQPRTVLPLVSLSSTQSSARLPRPDERARITSDQIPSLSRSPLRRTRVGLLCQEHLRVPAVLCLSLYHRGTSPRVMLA